MIDQETRQNMIQQAMTNKPTKPVRQGHGWIFTLTMCTFSLGLGIYTGMISDGTLEVVNAYNLKYGSRPATEAPVFTAAAKIDEPEAVGEPAWYPDNNKVEWSTSLRPGEQPAALDISNDGFDNNRRMLFYAIDQGTPRLAATLYVRAGQKALVHLPSGRYRIDMASTRADMPWDQAKNMIPLPSFALAVANDDENATRIVIDPQGKIHPADATTVAAKKSKSGEPKESSDETSDDPEISAA